MHKSASRRQSFFIVCKVEKRPVTDAQLRAEGSVHVGIGGEDHQQAGGSGKTWALLAQ